MKFSELSKIIDSNLGFDNEDENQSIIQEVSIGYDEKLKMSIHTVPNSGRNRGGDGAYFKICTGTSLSSAQKMNRISILNPVYVRHKNNGGADYLILTAKQGRELVKFLQKPTANGKTNLDHFD
jgi:hypothetical protein